MAILEGRRCVICKAEFDARADNEWWCSPSCRGILTSKSAEDVTEILREAAAVEEVVPEGPSEADKARAALHWGNLIEDQGAPDLATERLEIVALVAAAAAKATDPADRLVLAGVAGGFLDRVHESLESDALLQEEDRDEG